MTSTPDRLKIKRVPCEDWSKRELLCLASSVMKSGDQNWISVSRSLKPFQEKDSPRPPEWFSQKSCAAQYARLLENADTPKRKKRESGETAGESIVKKLTQERTAELGQSMTRQRDEYRRIKAEINAVNSGSLSEEALQKMWQAIESEEKEKEKDKTATPSTAWIATRQTTPQKPELTLTPKREPETPQESPTTSSPSAEETEKKKGGKSPLLTSLLKSPSPTHILTTPTTQNSPAIASLLGNSNSTRIALQQTVQTTSPQIQRATISAPIVTTVNNPPAQAERPSVGAPTLSALLELNNDGQKSSALSYLQATTTTTASVVALPTITTTTTAQDQSAVDSKILPDTTPEMADMIDHMMIDKVMSKDVIDMANVISNPEEFNEIIGDIEELIKGEIDTSTLDTCSAIQPATELAEMPAAQSVQPIVSDTVPSVVDVTHVTMQSVDPTPPNIAEIIGSVELPDTLTPKVVVTEPSPTGAMEAMESTSSQEEVAAMAENTSAPEPTPTLEEDSSSETIADSEASTRKVDEPSQDACETSGATIATEESKVEDSVNVCGEQEELMQSIKETTRPDETACKKDEAKILQEEETIESEPKAPVAEELAKEQETETDVPPVTTAEEPAAAAAAIQEQQGESDEDCDKPLLNESKEMETQDTQESVVIEERPKSLASKFTTEGEKTSEEKRPATRSEDCKDKGEIKPKASPHDKRERQQRVLVADSEAPKSTASKVDASQASDASPTAGNTSAASSIEQVEIEASDKRRNSVDEATKTTKEDKREEVISEETPNSNEEAKQSAEKSEESSKEVKRASLAEDRDELLANEVTPVDKVEPEIAKVVEEDGTSSEKPNDKKEVAESVGSSGDAVELDEDLELSTSSIGKLGSGKMIKTYSKRQSITAADSENENETETADYRAWKKLVLIVYQRLTQHKYASIFLKPITEEHAPGYHSVIFRPMDLSTIKKNIDNGNIRTTSKFQRDVLLMFQNAVMYNKQNSDIYRLVQSMREDALQEFQLLDEVSKDGNITSRRGTRTGTSSSNAGTSGFDMISAEVRRKRSHITPSPQNADSPRTKKRRRSEND